MPGDEVGVVELEKWKGGEVVEIGSLDSAGTITVTEINQPNMSDIWADIVLCI